ncbi:MAG: hypothetical protein M3Y46_07310 [Actinomycetota bacterium]|nr:hypothetical protein [Actinomycetota bacterium]
MSPSDTPDASTPDGTAPESAEPRPAGLATSDSDDATALLTPPEPEADAAPTLDLTEDLTQSLTPEPGAPTLALTPPAPAVDATSAAAAAAAAAIAAAAPPALSAYGPLTASAPASPAASLPRRRPRTRWAGIVWGLVLAAIAAVAVSILADPARQEVAMEWLQHLTPAAAVAYSVLVIGAFALIAGIVGLARRAQRGLERRREASVLSASS